MVRIHSKYYVVSFVFRRVEMPSYVRRCSPHSVGKAGSIIRVKPYKLEVSDVKAQANASVNANVNANQPCQHGKCGADSNK